MSVKFFTAYLLAILLGCTASRAPAPPKLAPSPAVITPAATVITPTAAPAPAPEPAVAIDKVSFSDGGDKYLVMSINKKAFTCPSDFVEVVYDGVYQGYFRYGEKISLPKPSPAGPTSRLVVLTPVDKNGVRGAAVVVNSP